MKVMRVKILKDATLTLTAGQVVEIKDDQLVTAVRLGLVELVKDEPVKQVKKTTKRS